jgi:signal transduction histidine kinase
MKSGTALFILAVVLSLLLLASGCTRTATGNATATLAITAAAEPVTTPALASNETLVAFVREAVSYAKTNGKDAAIAEFNKPNGSFVRGELYIYAYDFNGTTIAHPFNPEKIGINRLNETDAHGNYFIKDLRDAAWNGTGFVEFWYINPAHNMTVEKKLGYVEKVDDSWWLGSGIYENSA